MQESESLGYRKGKLPEVSCVWGDQRAVVRRLAGVTVRCGGRGTDGHCRRADSPLPRPVVSPSAPPLSTALAALGLQYQTEAERRLFYVSRPWMPPGAHVPPSLACLSSHVPRVLFICFCSSPLPSFIWKGLSSFQTLPLRPPSASDSQFLLPILSSLLNSQFLKKRLLFILSWFSNCPLNSLLILTSFCLPLFISLSPTSSLHLPRAFLLPSSLLCRPCPYILTSSSLPLAY